MRQKELADKMGAYLAYMEEEERSESTKQQYRREIERFVAYVGEEEMSKELAIRYKLELQKRYRVSSVNAKLAALNSYFMYLGEPAWRVKPLRIQQKAYWAGERELTRGEYLRLVEAAEGEKKEKLCLLLQTVCGTGIRVSELKYITVEAVESGEATIQLKGKTRTILLGGKLRKKLKGYMRQEGIRQGPIFVTRSGRPLDRSNIWKMLKRLSDRAGVTSGKVYPHNLRHLFARSYYEAGKDIVKLADILGHSNINTTRVYTISTGEEHRKRLEELGLVV